MARVGDSYDIELKEAHLSWGTHRYTYTRDRIYGEGYLPIPRRYAVAYEIFNGNNGIDTFGKNLFECHSVDGLYSGVLRAQGCSTANDVYAKQFSEDGNLKGMQSYFL